MKLEIGAYENPSKTFDAIIKIASNLGNEASANACIEECAKKLDITAQYLTDLTSFVLTSYRGKDLTDSRNTRRFLLTFADMGMVSILNRIQVSPDPEAYAKMLQVYLVDMGIASRIVSLGKIGWVRMLYTGIKSMVTGNDTNPENLQSVSINGWRSSKFETDATARFQYSGRFHCVHASGYHAQIMGQLPMIDAIPAYVDQDVLQTVEGTGHTIENDSAIDLPSAKPESAKEKKNRLKREKRANAKKQ